MTATPLAALVEQVRDRISPNDVGDRCIALEHLIPGQLRIEGEESPVRRRSSLLRFRDGDLLFGALRPGQRKVAIARGEGACSSELLVLRPRTGVGTGLALAALAHPGTTLAAERLATGARMPRVRWAALREVGVCLPPRPVQARLDRLMRLFDDRDHLIHREQQLKTRLLLRWIETHRAQDGPTLEEVADLRGQRPSPVETLCDGERFYGVSDLPSHGFDIHSWSTTRPRSGRRRVRRGELLVSLIRPERTKVGLCPAEGWASPEIIAITPHAGWFGAVMGALRSHQAQKRWIASSSGVRMPRFSLTTLRKTPVPLTERGRALLGPSLDALGDGILYGMIRAEVLRTARENLILTLLGGESPVASHCVGERENTG